MLVVGVDPGITTAIAILDAHGNVLNIYSKRDMSRGEVINHILKFGNPVVVSSDVSNVPKSVERIATKLGCIVYSPDTSPTLNEKRDLTREYYGSLKNDHEVDALSASIKAWKSHRTLFSKVNDMLKKFDKQEIFSDIALKVMKAESPNIEDAIREFLEKERPSVVIEKISKEEGVQRDVVEKLQKRLVEKQNCIDSLKNQNILLSKALNEIRKQMNELRKIKPKVDTTEDYQKLRNSIDYIKKLRKAETKGYYPLIEFEKVDGSSLEQMNDMIDLDNRVVFVGNKENLNLLNDKNIKCLLIPDGINFDIENLEFSVVQIGKDVIENFDDIKAVKIDYIEKRLTDAKKSGLVGWLKSYKKRRS